MTLSDLQTFIGSLTNDPNHDRYSLSDINTELDNSQNKWNLAAKIIKHTVNLTSVSGRNQWNIRTYITGTPISFERVTFNGILLQKRSKSWLDLYAGGSNWSLSEGTPNCYFIEAEDTSALYLTFYPIPTSADDGKTIVVEYIQQHVSMTIPEDVPFLADLGSGTYTSNYLLRPYDYGLAYDAAARLLLRDPSSENAKKSADYLSAATNILTEVIQVFKSLEEEEPKKWRGGRYWNSGVIRLAK